MTVPNLITAIRIILTPIFIIYLINDQFLSALIVFILCAISDGLDGMLARLLKQKSKLGAYLDPLADKSLLIAAFITLSVRGLLPPWLTVMVIARDVLILLGIIVLFLNKLELNIKPSIISKITTCLQFITVVSVLARNLLPFGPDAYLYIFYITALFTISSGLHYMHYGFRLMGEGSQDRKSQETK
ncbi:MAG: CDP-alcohol phosphatidyltransferase family protein [Deltaproteobacteria bacterium]|nr:CDP-alcohol phosphatidyltransferase family protein [Deltaproteobacteria bacterium]